MYEFIAYVVLGIVVMVTGFYLHIYYATHYIRITKLDPNGSKYFKSLSKIFIPVGLYGTITTISGIIALTGFRTPFLEVLPLITVLILCLFVIPLIGFCKATAEE